jgi:hypothetical protein
MSINNFTVFLKATGYRIPENGNMPASSTKSRTHTLAAAGSTGRIIACRAQKSS